MTRELFDAEKVVRVPRVPGVRWPEVPILENPFSGPMDEPLMIRTVRLTTDWHWRIHQRVNEIDIRTPWECHIVWAYDEPTRTFYWSEVANG